MEEDKIVFIEKILVNEKEWLLIIFVKKDEEFEIQFNQIVADHVNIRNQQGQTPLMKAAICNNEVLVKYLLLSKASLDIQDNNGDTALRYACRLNNIATVRELLKAKADVNLSDFWLFSPLMEAAQDGHQHIAKMLLDCNAFVDARDQDNDTALSMSVYFRKKNYHSLVKLLLRECPDFSFGLGTQKSTVLLDFIHKDVDVIIIESLLRQGASVNDTNHDGMNAAMIAIDNAIGFHPHPQLISLILMLYQHGANFNVKLRKHTIQEHVNECEYFQKKEMLGVKECLQWVLKQPLQTLRKPLVPIVSLDRHLRLI